MIFGNLETLRQISTVTIDFKLADIKLDSSSRRSLLFFLPLIFFRSFRLSLAPTICPWVSEDDVRQDFLTC